MAIEERSRGETTDDSPTPPLSASDLANEDKHDSLIVPLHSNMGDDHPVHTTIDELENELNLSSTIDTHRLLSHDGGHTLSQLLDLSPDRVRYTCSIKMCNIPLVWLLSILIGLSPVGRFFVYDFPGSIFSELQQHMGEDNYTRTSNMLLYSIVSWPNVILCLFAGSILRYLTVWRGCTILTLIVAIGQLLVTIGAQSRSFWLMFIGRLVFGLGSELAGVSRSAYLVRWLSGPSLTLAFSVNIAIARVGSLLAFAIVPSMIHGAGSLESGISITFWVGTLSCLLGVVCCYIAQLLDRYADKRVEDARKQVLKIVHERHQGELVILNENTGSKVSSLSLSWTSIKSLHPLVFHVWIVTFIWYMCGIGFFTVASDLLQHSGNYYSSKTASLYVSLTALITVILMPIFGKILDLRGRALNAILFSTLLMAIGQLLFYYSASGSTFSPVPFLILHGIGYALGCSALWPTLAYVAPPSSYGLAMGGMSSSVNFSMALTPLIVAWIQAAGGSPSSNNPNELSWRYRGPPLLFLFSSIICMLHLIYFIVIDKRRYHSIMNSNENEREQLKAQQEVEEHHAIIHPNNDQNNDNHHHNNIKSNQTNVPRHFHSSSIEMDSIQVNRHHIVNGDKTKEWGGVSPSFIDNSSPSPPEPTTAEVSK